MDVDSCVIKRANEHFEVYVNGRFYCSADTYTEAARELELYEVSQVLVKEHEGVR